MSKTIKGLIIEEYQARISGVEEAALISIRGVSSNDTNRIRSKLRAKQIKVSVVRNALARKAIEGTALSNLGPMLEGSSALAYGGQSVVEVAREIVALLETFPSIELKGAVLDGTLYKGKAGVTELSKFPTREEAQAQAVTLILGPGRKLVGDILGPGRTIAGIVKAIEEKLEKGETIAKIA
ncbi:MAG: 50S ribosomal protein L10 [Phycisphaeraceae bacterium]|nr:50S ribosomal protein L10 [Phycisphaeraceae bacterium]